MTLARRVVPIIEFDAQGYALGGWQRGGMNLEFVETVARYLAAEGADEIWLRLTEPDVRGASGLYDPVKSLRGALFIPLVAWGAIRSASDARLMVGLGADRVVIDCTDPEVPDPIGMIAQIAQTVGPDRVSATVVARRVADKQSFTWELCDSSGEGLGQDAWDFVLELTSAGAGEVVFQPFFDKTLSAHATDFVERLSGHIPQQVVSIGSERELADVAGPILMGADAVASASLFRDGQHSVRDVKTVLREYGVVVRPATGLYVPRL